MAETGIPANKDLKLIPCHFDDMNLQVEDRLEIVLEESVDKTPHFATLIGYARDDALVLRTPLVNGLPLPMREEEQVLVRVFSGLKAYSFSAIVVRVGFSPFPHIYLSFPPTVNGIEIRKSLRVKVDLRAAVSGPDPMPVQMEGHFINISVMGAELVAPVGIGAKGDHIKVSFSFFAEPEQHPVDLTLEALVQNVKLPKAEEGHGNLAHYGLAFQRVAWDQAVLIQNLVYRQLLGSHRNIA
jgi:hypothetical protein